MYGKATETAIAALTRLAEVYDGGVTRLSATDIAENRGLQRPFVAKVLTALSQAGFVTGTRGPGGGFTLAVDPTSLTLYDVYQLFEREDNSDTCPFGGGICGVGDPCPLHDKLVRVQEAIADALENTSLEDFRIAYQVEGLRPSTRRPARKKRESYRASVKGRRRK